MDHQLEAVYSKEGRLSIPPERLLRTSLLQVLFTIRFERQLVEHIEYNLLYRWFVRLDIDDPVWDHNIFTQNRGVVCWIAKCPGISLQVSNNWQSGWN
ncbi:transposase [Nitrosomonas sp. Is79A3]|uniref:transposase n=1 Tax=Nitrosomonas sp. (strain Is79A3) TaxID=261292 RepID=UPI0002FF12CC